MDFGPFRNTNLQNLCDAESEGDMEDVRLDEGSVSPAANDLTISTSSEDAARNNAGVLSRQEVNSTNCSLVKESNAVENKQAEQVISL